MVRFSILATVTGLMTCLLSWRQCAGFSTQSTRHHVPSHPQRTTSDGEDHAAVGRRELLHSLARCVPLAVAAAITLPTPPPAHALDFDAFESRVIATDEDRAAPKLNDDEALCRYGAPGKAMGAACERAKMKPNLPSVVNASGQVDRGEYLKCKIMYPKDAKGDYVKTRVCKPSSDWGNDEGE